MTAHLTAPRTAPGSAAGPRPAPLLTGHEHVSALLTALPRLDVGRLDGWGRALADVLLRGGRLLAAGNGGSAAQAQHLTAELVGRYRDERRPLSAIALHSDTSTATAVSNDYGYPEVFARQVLAHGRGGDVLLVLSTSGRSPNLVRAVDAARSAGVTSWALTGPAPNPLADVADESVLVEAAATATIQEVHQVAIHVVCAAVDAAVLGSSR